MLEPDRVDKNHDFFKKINKIGFLLFKSNFYDFLN